MWEDLDFFPICAKEKKKKKNCGIGQMKLNSRSFEKFGALKNVDWDVF